MKQPKIYDTTFTYIINSADTQLEGRLDRFFDSERWILTSEWYQHMGFYLPSNKEFECQTVRYEFGTNYINDGATSLDMATMIYSNINEYGKNSLAIDKLNTNRLNPISNYSNMCSRFNGVRQGATRYNANISHDCTFISKNFNGENKYFRLNTIIKNKPVNQFAPDEFFNTAIWAPNHYVPTNGEAISLNYNGGLSVRYPESGYNIRVLKSFNNAPITTIYMTPIPEPYEPIPRILLKEDSIIYTISSFERTKNLYKNINNQILNTGAHCIVPFRKQKDSMVRRYKAQVIAFNFNTELTDPFYVAGNPNNLQMMFGFRTSCGWNKSKYGYLASNPLWGVEEDITGVFGAKGGNGFSNLTHFRPAIDNDIDRQYPVSFGACFDINNEDTDVEYCIYSSMGYTFGSLGGANACFPYKDLVEPKMDWILTLRLYPLN